MEQDMTVTTPITDNSKSSNGKGWKIAAIITSILAVCGIGFGGFELWQNIKNNQAKVPTTLLSLDKNNSLGKKLYEQVQAVTATDSCGQEYHPLYNFPENEYVIKYEDLPDSTKSEIIVKETPEITSFNNNEEIHPECGAPRYGYRYEYVGLSNTINNQISNNSEDNKQMAMIVLEKKTIDRMIEDDEERSDGYYGVLFRGGQNSEEFFWVGAYYLGNIIEE